MSVACSPETLGYFFYRLRCDNWNLKIVICPTWNLFLGFSIVASDFSKSVFRGDNSKLPIRQICSGRLAGPNKVDRRRTGVPFFLSNDLGC